MSALGPRPAATQEGSGTVLVVCLLGLLLVLTGLIASAGVVRAHQVRLQAVADLAALAGADVSASAPWIEVGARPCERAGSIAEANGAEVGSCEVIGSDTRVHVSREVEVWGLHLQVGAGARAGPEDR